MSERLSPAEYGRQLALADRKPLTEQQVESAAHILASVERDSATAEAS